MLIAILFGLISNWNNEKPLYQITISYDLVGLILIVYLVRYFSKILANIINIESVIKKKLALLLLITVGWLFSVIYIRIFNPLYNRLGKVS